jgi:hypothetical protein
MCPVRVRVCVCVCARACMCLTFAGYLPLSQFVVCGNASHYVSDHTVVLGDR